ncbi:MAG: efflux RND transporter periplasmic adaptor subunit [Deltaproteobacteria bacterium]|nr:efflux RND transporter periplasmic adaptor subunit [Deltaproteobacteria bacterium]
MSRRTTFILFACVLLVAAALVAGCGASSDTAKKFHCPMHPTYISDRQGDCPICGMRLVPIESESDHVSATPAPATHDVYTCPMHAQVVSDEPGECPICGMDLVKRESAPDAHAGHDAAGGVDGMSTVELAGTALNLSGIKTAIARRDRLAGSVRAVGTVAADERRVRVVHTKVEGYVEKLHANFTGGQVRRGDPIMAIFSPELLATQQEYLRAYKTAQQFAASSIEEVQEGGKELIAASRRRLELFDVPESFIHQLETTGESKRTVTLVAPVSGYVTGKDVFEGQRVEPGMPLYTVTDLSRVWVEVDIYEYEARRVTVGAPATIALAFDPDTRIAAKVAYVNPTLNAESRTLKVRFDVPNPKLVLKPGMFANVELETGGDEGIVIPDSAVLDTGARQVVFVETAPGQYEPREVKVVAKSNDMVQISEGVRDGERVVTTANFLLDSESRIKAAIAGSGGDASHAH